LQPGWFSESGYSLTLTPNYFQTILDVKTHYTKDPAIGGVPTANFDPQNDFYVDQSVLNPPWNGGQVLKLTQSMSDSDFTTLTSKVSNAILSLGIQGSSKSEIRCTLAQMLAETSEGTSKSILTSGDKVAFVLISDDEDKTHLSPGADTYSCLRKYTSQVIHQILKARFHLVTIIVRPYKIHWHYTSTLVRRRRQIIFVQQSKTET
jgi:hypothetical protein